jgi:hypothetical protein
LSSSKPLAELSHLTLPSILGVCLE